jgi:hypothetical protein
MGGAILPPAAQVATSGAIFGAPAFPRRRKPTQRSTTFLASSARALLADGATTGAPFRPYLPKITAAIINATFAASHAPSTAAMTTAR